MFRKAGLGLFTVIIRMVGHEVMELNVGVNSRLCTVLFVIWSGPV